MAKHLPTPEQRTAFCSGVGEALLQQLAPELPQQLQQQRAAAARASPGEEVEVWQGLVNLEEKNAVCARKPTRRQLPRACLVVLTTLQYSLPEYVHILLLSLPASKTHQHHLPTAPSPLLLLCVMLCCRCRPSATSARCCLPRGRRPAVEVPEKARLHLQLSAGDGQPARQLAGKSHIRTFGG